MLAFALATIPESAYAGWVVEGEPTVLVGYGGHYVSELGTQATHHGIDCLASAGAQCLFPTEGTVSFVGDVPAGDLPGCGTTMAVSIRIDDGRTVTLMPLDDVAVQVGQRVSEGQTAGTVASSGDGSTTLPHVHVGLKRNRTYYDPSEILGIAAPAVDEEGESASQPAPAAVVGEPPSATEQAPAASSDVPVALGESAQSLEPVPEYTEESLASSAASTVVADEVPTESEGRPETSSTLHERISSAAAGAKGSAYESWLAACGETSPGASGAVSSWFASRLDDVTALLRSAGLSPRGAALGLAACLGMVILAFVARRKESDQVAGKDMRFVGELGSACERRVDMKSRLSMIGHLMAARQAK